jgi:hypothetical protein
VKLLVVLATGAAVAAPAPKPVKLDLKPGLALAFSASVADGKVVLGAARAGKFGELRPNDGEIVVGLSPKDKTLYENVVVVEKTAAPVDFLATGYVGGTKIDEIWVHGKLDGPVSQRIGATSWVVTLNGFEAGAAPAK